MVLVLQFDCKANLRGINDNLVRKNIAFVRLAYVDFEIEIPDEFSNDYLKVPDDFLNTRNHQVNLHFSKNYARIKKSNEKVSS